ncbi:unnamed protein product, partial [Brassica rapa subsp. trilocularis]
QSSEQNLNKQNFIKTQRKDITEDQKNRGYKKEEEEEKE